MVKKRVYSSTQIEAVVQMKRAFPEMSVRALGKLASIPKSVIGRWIKEPDFSIQKTQIKEIKKTVSKVDKVKLAKLEAKLEKPNSINQGRLRIRHADGSFDVISY